MHWNVTYISPHSKCNLCVHVSVKINWIKFKKKMNLKEKEFKCNGVVLGQRSVCTAQGASIEGQGRRDLQTERKARGKIPQGIRYWYSWFLKVRKRKEAVWEKRSTLKLFHEMRFPWLRRWKCCLKVDPFNNITWSKRLAKQDDPVHHQAGGRRDAGLSGGHPLTGQVTGQKQLLQAAWGGPQMGARFNPGQGILGQTLA